MNLPIEPPPKQHDKEVYEGTQAAGLARKMGLFVPRRMVADFNINMEDGLRVCVIGSVKDGICTIGRVWLDSDPESIGIQHLLNDDALDEIERKCIEAYYDRANKADFMEDMK